MKKSGEEKKKRGGKRQSGVGLRGASVRCMSTSLAPEALTPYFYPDGVTTQSENMDRLLQWEKSLRGLMQRALPFGH